jgi:NAD-dependent dihydropyrimidine dehydrogenase PreA subunit
MPAIEINESGCRDCALCVEICPTKVLEIDEAKHIARAARPEDCIGCTSCAYICPSRCLTVTDYIAQRPFHRIEENARLISRFLQRQPVEAQLSEGDFQEALKDVRVRLKALGEAVGRAAGTLAASHLPEMYEQTSLSDLLDRMSARFAHAFSFQASVVNDGAKIALTFKDCAFCRVASQNGDTVGSAVLCTLFHEYWAGLLGAFASQNYTVETPDAKAPCAITLQARA